jgi:hypothetical protein
MQTNPPDPQRSDSVKRDTVAGDRVFYVSYYHNFRPFQKYKYCLVMENSAVSGYIIEVLVDAFIGGCLPIYYYW